MIRTRHSFPEANVGSDQSTAELPRSVDDPRVVELVEQYRESLEAGEEPDRQRLLDQFPQLVEELSACLDGLEFVTRVAPQLIDDSPTDKRPSPTAWKAARTLGDFRILNEIGRGGMGVVYEAEQISLQRQVALKVLPFAAVLDPRQLQRFKNEAQAAAGLHHTNIVPVYSVGCERGVHFYAMQYVEGQTVAEVIGQLRQPSPLINPKQRDDLDAIGGSATDLVSGRFCAGSNKSSAADGTCGHVSPSVEPPPTAASLAGTAARSIDDSAQAFQDTKPTAAVSTERSTRSPAFFRSVAELGIQVAGALDHAHQQGVVHRDIKPSNLIVESHGKVWVTDFGLARIETGANQLTMSGDLLGTLRYMSPEQALAKRIVVDHRTDIYSLGVTLYELLTLQPAFAGEDREAVLRQIIFDEPQSPRRLNKAINVELETVILKAMAKNAAERYGTAQELADDLHRFLENKPIQARRPSLAHRLAKWSRRHRLLVWSAGLFLVMAACSLALSTALIWQEKQRTEEALEESKAVVNFLVTDLLGAAEPERSLGREVTVKEVLANAENEIETAFRDQPLVEATVRHVMGVSYRGLGQFDAAKRHLLRARDLRVKLRGPEHPETLSSMHALALVLQNQGQLEEASGLLKQTLEIARRVLGNEHPNTLSSMHNVANVFHKQGQLEKAQKVYEQTIELRRRVLGPEHRATLQSMYNLASVFGDLGQLEEARELHEETLEIQRRILGTEDLDTVTSMQNLAVRLHRQGELDEAREIYEQTVKFKRRVFGPAHRTTLQSMYNLASVFGDLGQLEEARELNEETLEIQRDVLGAEHPDTLRSMRNLALDLRGLGQLEEARELNEETLEIQRRVLGAEHPETLRSMSTLALDLKDQGQLEVAIILLEQTLEVQRRVLGAEHPETLRSMNNLAFLFKDHGQLDKASKLHEKTLKIRHRILGAEHTETLASMLNLAWTLVFDPDQTLADAERAVELASKAVEHAPGGHYDILGVAHYRAGNWSVAIETLEKSLRLQGNNAQDMCFLAMAHRQLGHLDEARRYYAEAVDLFKDDAPQDKELNGFIAEAADLLKVANPFKPIDKAPTEPPASPVS